MRWPIVCAAACDNDQVLIVDVPCSSTGLGDSGWIMPAGLELRDRLAGRVHVKGCSKVVPPGSLLAELYRGSADVSAQEGVSCLTA